MAKNFRKILYTLKAARNQMSSGKNGEELSEDPVHPERSSEPDPVHPESSSEPDVIW